METFTPFVQQGNLCKMYLHHSESYQQQRRDDGRGNVGRLAGDAESPGETHSRLARVLLHHATLAVCTASLLGPPSMLSSRLPIYQWGLPSSPAGAFAASFDGCNQFFVLISMMPEDRQGACCLRPFVVSNP